MSNTVIKVENLSKQYRLGTIGTGALAHDVNRWWHRVRGKEDPYLKIGESNDRTQKGSSEYVWALKDINFEVKHGEVLGIIGRNGAGKSTLLKILSRTTAPTTGSVKIKGRVASLLEVGTGFHPELSGRENVFLNGAILGMTQKEIIRKFDEIVDFAGVERYIDTPVKRYSSGMYVRLAFAVAAHLEPEILIVDEVLAVGDAEFQKKCLGKMKDVSEREGRTVLFVSHNMLAIQNICDEVMVIHNGKIVETGSPSLSVIKYLKAGQSMVLSNNFDNITGRISENIHLISARIEIETDKIMRSQQIPVLIRFQHKINEPFYVNMILRHISGDVVFESATSPRDLPEGIAEAYFLLPPNFLNNDSYSIQVNFTTQNIRMLGYKTEIITFHIEDEKVMDGFYGRSGGYIRPEITNYLRALDV